MGGHPIRPGPVRPGELPGLPHGHAGGWIQAALFRIVAEQDGGGRLPPLQQAEGLLPDAAHAFGERRFRGEAGQALPRRLQALAQLAHRRGHPEPPRPGRAMAPIRPAGF
jgi:hypothetical protein